MSSINTNASAMTALQSLSATNKNLSITQGRISTGLRVAEASDNSAYWSIATTMRSDNKALSSVQDALGLGAGRLDVAYTATNSAIDVVDKIKQKLVTAMSASEDDKLKIQGEIKELQGQLTSIGLSANYAGGNLIANDQTETELNIVSSYDRTADGTVKVNTITVDLSKTQLLDETGTDGGILADVMAIELDGTEDNDGIQAHLDTIEDALKQMADAAATLGAAKARVDMQKDFVSKLSDAIDRGVGQLVDADMNKESTRLQALQVQQQLGIQALSIANSNSQSILSLFR
ncbi:flagellin N-terminal helical domain-containing protein [Mesorhizobium sp. PUT5]|uniref:flagellin N-terminal helical domain-containing protein n=1 Tax=Mesorhizobium sp. PUT5 TaxID=3454629 RepID=UPI003FA42CE1